MANTPTEKIGEYTVPARDSNPRPCAYMKASAMYAERLWVRLPRCYIPWFFFLSGYLPCGSRFMLSKFNCNTLGWNTVPSFLYIHVVMEASGPFMLSHCQALGRWGWRVMSYPLTWWRGANGEKIYQTEACLKVRNDWNEVKFMKYERKFTIILDMFLILCVFADMSELWSYFIAVWTRGLNHLAVARPHVLIIIMPYCYQNWLLNVSCNGYKFLIRNRYHIGYISHALHKMF